MTTTGTVTATTALRPPTRSTRVVVDRPIDRVVVVGDSVTFDGRDRPGGRANEIVPLIAETVRAQPELATVQVDNWSRPGLATKFAINPNMNRDLDTLAEYLPDVIGTGVDSSTLLVIAVSSIDVTVKEDLPVAEVASEVVAELRRLRDEFAATDVPIAFLPAFGVNDEMFDNARNGLSANRQRHGLSRRVHALNEALRASDLPMLIAEFADLDTDGVGGADEEYFVGYDTVGEQWPDDGVHANRVGERFFADAVAPALVEVLAAARSGAT